MRTLTPLLLFCLLGATSAILGIGIGRKQSAGVRGQLRCHGEPIANVKIKVDMSW